MAKGQNTADQTTPESAVGALDEMEPELRHLDGLITALRILGEADDSIEPIAMSSLARCARESLEQIEQDWRTAIRALRTR